MATIRSFEDLEIWKKAHEIGALIYRLCETNEKIAKDFSFKDQIKRASLSISNNIAEGFEYNNNNDFYRFLRIAKGSCGEVKNCLLFSVTVRYSTLEDITECLLLCNITSQQIGGLMKYINDIKKSQTERKDVKAKNRIIKNPPPSNNT